MNPKTELLELLLKNQQERVSAINKGMDELAKAAEKVLIIVKRAQLLQTKD